MIANRHIPAGYLSSNLLKAKQDAILQPQPLKTTPGTRTRRLPTPQAQGGI
jgi:hypothetical protein